MGWVGGRETHINIEFSSTSSNIGQCNLISISILVLSKHFFQSKVNYIRYDKWLQPSSYNKRCKIWRHKKKILHILEHVWGASRWAQTTILANFGTCKSTWTCTNHHLQSFGESCNLPPNKLVINPDPRASTTNWIIGNPIDMPSCVFIDDLVKAGNINKEKQKKKEEENSKQI